MVIRYRKLWRLLIDKKLNKADLARMTGISATTISAMSADRAVSLNVLSRICDALDCDLFDILETSRGGESYSNASKEASCGR